MLVASMNTMLTRLDICSQNGVCIGKIQKTIKQSRVHAEVIWPINSFHVKNIKFDCLNFLLKQEEGKIFHKIRIFYSIEFFIVSTVTDRKCSVTNNVVLAIMIYNTLTNTVRLACHSNIYNNLYDNDQGINEFLIKQDFFPTMID